MKVVSYVGSLLCLYLALQGLSFMGYSLTYKVSMLKPTVLNHLLIASKVA